ncbi:MAG: 4Fe-4S binding protein [Acidobacteriota bacterium]
MSTKQQKKHFRKRVFFFVAGMLLFVAPFAFLLTATGYLSGAYDADIGAAAAQSEPTVHRAMCLRMPLSWIVWQPDTLLSRLEENPLYALVFALILLAIFIGPLFCGWLCPGIMTEHLSRLVPDRWKIDLKGIVDPAPVRYGFMVGFFLMAAPFINKSICCSYCNWTWVEDTWLVLFGDMDGVTGGSLFQFSSSSIITFLLAFGFLGVFMKGGRGWCNFLCPAGALQNLAHWLGARFRFTYKLLLESDRCNDCMNCVDACPTRAILPARKNVSINRHICNGCKECVAACPREALAYCKGGLHDKQ